MLSAGALVYPRLPHLAEKHFYVCRPCAAWVGCHPGTTAPLGRLANAELRRAKQQAHAAFDPLWKAKMERVITSKKLARSEAYAWLAQQLGIHHNDCHIGMFDLATCKRVVAICAETEMLP